MRGLTALTNRDGLPGSVRGAGPTAVQAVGVIFAGLAFHYAPTRSDQDRLLEEEAERLNKSWMAQPGGPPVTSYDRGRG